MDRHLQVEVVHPNGERRKYRFLVRGDSSYCWVECGKAAPPVGVIFPALVYCGLVQVVREDGSLTVAVPSRWKDSPMGVWGRTGSTGAYWGHAWRVDPDGYRIGHWVASWHASMAGKANEDVQGDPYALAVAWALREWADLVRDGVEIAVKDEIPTVPIEHPARVSDPGSELPEPVVEDRVQDDGTPLEPAFPPPPTD